MKFLSSLLVLAPLALAAPTVLRAAGSIQARACDVQCGSTCYSNDQLQTALDAGYGDYASGTAVHNYPHTYNDYEGFSFPADGPYQEFPIKISGAYTGGSPGADRIIFNTNGDYAGSVTHTGASGNNFVGCSDTS